MNKTTYFYPKFKNFR